MGHTFKLNSNDNKVKNKKVKMDYSLIIMIVCILVAIICIIISIVLSVNSKKLSNETIVNNNDNISYIEKEDATKEYVYTIEKNINTTQEETYDEVPYINISTKDVEKINKEIKDKYLLVSKKTEYGYSYKYSEGNGILSLLIEYIYSPVQNSYPVSFYKTYNVDMKTGTIIKPKEVLSRYNITVDELKIFVASRFQKYYDDIVKKGYYKDKSCDYNCFLQNRGITTDYLKGVSLYVDNGELTLYKFFYKNSDYDEGNYFDNISYQIVVKK